MRNIDRKTYWAPTLLRAAPSALLAVAVCSLAWNQNGSIAIGDWGLYAALGAMLVAAILVSGWSVVPPTAGRTAVVALIALGIWDVISATWSAVPSHARDEALLAGFYALVLAVPMLSLRGESDRHLAAGVTVACLMILAVGTLVAVRLAGDPAADYGDGRLTFPISYVNAQGAMQVIGFFPALALAADRTLNVVVRALALGGSTAMLVGWLLTQSKGAGLSLLAGAVFLVAASPSRLRVLAVAVVPVALVLGAYSPLTEPFRDRNAAGFADAIRSATTTALVLCAVATVIGAAYAVVDRRVIVPERARRAAAVGAALAATLAVVGGITAFFVGVDHPGRFAHDRWASFKRLPTTESGSSHLVSLGSNRYDFWRVELRMSADHPLGGIGARGFGTCSSATAARLPSAVTRWSWTRWPRPASSAWPCCSSHSRRASRRRSRLRAARLRRPGAAPRRLAGSCTRPPTGSGQSRRVVPPRCSFSGSRPHARRRRRSRTASRCRWRAWRSQPRSWHLSRRGSALA